MTDIERALAAAKKIKDLQAQIADLTEAVENLKAKEVEYFEAELGEHIIGDNDEGFLKVTIYQSKTYNEAYGKKQAPDLWARFAERVEVLSSARAKDKMTEDEYTLFQKPSAKLSVKIEVVSE